MFERTIHVAFISTDIVGIGYFHRAKIETFLEGHLRSEVPSGWCGRTVKIDRLTGGYKLGIVVPQPPTENRLIHTMMRNLDGNVPMSAQMIGLTCVPECEACQAVYYAIATDCGLCKIVYDLQQAQQVLRDELKKLVSAKSENTFELARA